MSGAKDETVFAVCVAEQRVLVTLDRDFGEVLRFPPQSSSGIVVLDLRGRASPARVLERLRGFLELAKTHSVDGSLWIVEPGRVRVHGGVE
jgi:predicted nuclease of predicted toxin-antitoxin system